MIGLKDQISPELFQGIEYDVFPTHAVSKILQFLREKQIKNLVFAGRVKRTKLSKLLLDPKGAKLLALILKNGLSDNSLLSTIMMFFEKEGFQIYPVETLLTHALAEEGNLTPKIPIKDYALDDIAKGYKILKGIARFDVGQALVIQGGLVLGVEAAEGTDELIKRSGEIKQIHDSPPILIKVCKPFQDKRIDLPCIGPRTIEMLDKCGISGVAIEANTSIIVERDATLDKAAKLGVFVYGYSENTDP